MKSVKFLLIHPASRRGRSPGSRRSLDERLFHYPVLPGLYVAASVPDYVETRILDEDVEDIDFGADVDLVGLSFMTSGAPRAYEIAARFREERGIPVVMGGYHPTLCPDEASLHCDAVCVGDAENKMRQIMEDFRAGSLKPIYNGQGPDLATIPRPRRQLLSRAGRILVDQVMATRGCPHRCTFCSVAQFHGHTFRKRPVEDVVDELKTLRTRVAFVDDNLIGDRAYALELCEAISPLGKRWYAQSSMRIAEDDELLGSMVASGCRGLFLGLESLSPENLASCRKQFNRPDGYLTAIRRMHEAGLAVFVGIVFGMDDDTPAVFARTVEFLEEGNVEGAAFNILTPFPGTPLFDEMDREGRILSYDWSKFDFNHVVIRPRLMTPKTLEQGAMWARSRYYSRRSVARRLRKSSQYLDPGTLIKSVAAMNLGMRARMIRSGTMEKGLASPPPDQLE